MAQGGVRPQARFWGITGHYRPPDAWFSHVQRKIGAGQGAYRPVDTCLDKRIPGLYFLSTPTDVDIYRVLARTVLELAMDRGDLDKMTLERFNNLLGKDERD